MSEPTLSLTLWDIRREVARMLAIGTVYSTGTVASSGSTTMTLTGGAWPESANVGFVTNKVTGERIAIASRDSSTVLTMATSSNWGSGIAYEFAPWGQEEEDDLTNDIDEGYRRFVVPPPTQNRARTIEWSFLSPQASLETNAPYSTGTITIAAGVVTLTSGTFPTWAAAGELLISEGSYAGRRFPVSTRDSGTQVTLDDTTVTEATAREFVLVQNTYDLPDDWSGMVGQGFTFRPGISSRSNSIIRSTSSQHVDAMNERTRERGTPTLYAVRPKTFSGSVGQRWEVVFYPTPAAAFTLEYYYRAMPNRLTATNPKPYGGMHHSSTLMASCMAVAEERRNDTDGLRRARFQELLMSSIDLDERQSSPRTLGIDSRQFSNEGHVRSTLTYPIESTYHPGFFI